MKNNKWIISILSIFVLLFVSCKDSFIHDFKEQKETATLSFSVNGSSSRNILPDNSVEDYTNVLLTGTLNGAETPVTLGNWDSFYAMFDDSLEVEAGSWNLELSARKESVDFTATTSVTVAAGQTKDVYFVLEPVNAQNGIAKIKLRYPKEANVALANWRFIPVNSNSPLLDTYSSAATKSGICCIDTTFNEGDALQEITDTAFTLKTELPEGKYIFKCNFGYQYGELQITSQGMVGISSLGDYCDFIVIQDGLVSKLDYTIDYFELLGITNAVSTAAGMELSIQVPKGVENIVIERVTDFYGIMSNPTEENMANNVMAFIKVLDAPTTSSTTMTFVDSYGYTAGQTLTYVVFYNYFSRKHMNSYYIKEFTTSNNGLPIPGFSTYPEFDYEYDQDGKTTKIKLATEPVINWKGHALDSDYVLFVTEDYDDALFTADYKFTKDKKEFTVDPDELHAGPNSLEGYRWCFEKDGWYHNCGIVRTGLSSSQLPVLYGRPNAIPTNRGIDIEVYCDWPDDKEEVKLLRSTSPDGEYTMIKDFAEVYNNTYTCIDRDNLQKDVTYYYKLVGESGYIYSAPYFSATSSINYGEPLILQSNPKLQVSSNSIATFTAGNYQIDEHVKRIEFTYCFKQSDKTSVKLSMSKMRWLDNGIWYEGDLSAMLWELHEDGSISFDYTAFEYASNNSISLYVDFLDGKQFVLESVLISCYEDNYSLIKMIEFTPGAQECTSSFVIHTDTIQFDTQSTENGIILDIRNIPQAADSISIISQDSNFDDYERFRVNNLGSTTSISLLDSYVNTGIDYGYTIYAYDGDTLLDYATSASKSQYCYNGGSDELKLTATVSANGVELSFNTNDDYYTRVIERKMNTYIQNESGICTLTPHSLVNQFTDYFVRAGITYYYILSARINYSGNDSIIYTPRSTAVPVYVDSDSYRYPKITKVPEYTYNVDESDNLNITFTGTPVVFKDDGLPEFTVSRLDLYFKYDSLFNFTIPYTGSNTKTYPVEIEQGFTFKHDLQENSYGVVYCDDFAYEGYILITDEDLGSYDITLEGSINN